jgi:hypothetical protein
MATETKTRHALELLERWSRSPMLDPFGPVPGTSELPTDGAPVRHPTEPKKESRPKPKPVFRLDSAHAEPVAETDEVATPITNSVPESETPTPASPERPATEDPTENATEEVTATHRIDQVHAASVLAPHFDVQAVIQQNQQRKTNWLGLAGQLLAYLGVALLTIGTSMVLWGYFGGPKNYAPTGWLITTAGQMLLFLGVITLVSGGMEQTTEEVRTRIDVLGQQILRIEQASHDRGLSGPHFSMRKSADDEAARDSDNSHQAVG